jgi:hypothetical protein
MSFGSTKKRKPREGIGPCYRCGKGPCKLKPHPEAPDSKPGFCASCEGILCQGLASSLTSEEQAARTLPARQARRDASKRLGALWPSKISPEPAQAQPQAQSEQGAASPEPPGPQSGPLPRPR